MPKLRTLGPGDEAALERFLLRHAASSMFLRSNARRGGLADHGAVYQATYVAAEDDTGIVAVAAHAWLGILLVQASVHLDAVVRAAVRRSGRALIGISGPRDQVVAARAALGLAATPVRRDSHEDLFSLALDALVVPPALARGEVRCRAPLAAELDLVTDWRLAFLVEVTGAIDGPALRAHCREEVERWHDERSDFVLEAGGRPVAYSVFNARLPDVVQIGGVWTPPELRGRGHARAVVAGSLLEARAAGVRQAILFTARANAPARAAYLALGFHAVGDYGLLLLADEVRAASVPAGESEK